MIGLDFSKVQDRLQDALAGPLPGGDAHRLLAPVPRPNWVPGVVPADAKPAAVLVLLYPLPVRKSDSPLGCSLPDDIASLAVCPPAEVVQGAGLIFTERTDQVQSHQRQICFPGGSVDGDETVEETALREAEEEIGIPRDLPHVLGRLSPLWISATGFTVTPVLAVCPALPALTPNSREVERIIEFPLVELMLPGKVFIDTQETAGIWVKIPHFVFPHGKLWGATAMMTAELLTLLGWSLDNSGDNAR